MYAIGWTLTELGYGSCGNLAGLLYAARSRSVTAACAIMCLDYDCPETHWKAPKTRYCLPRFATGSWWLCLKLAQTSSLAYQQVERMKCVARAHANTIWALPEMHKINSSRLLLQTSADLCNCRQMSFVRMLKNSQFTPGSTPSACLCKQTQHHVSSAHIRRAKAQFSMTRLGHA